MDVEIDKWGFRPVLVILTIEPHEIDKSSITSLEDVKALLKLEAAEDDPLTWIDSCSSTVMLLRQPVIMIQRRRR